MNTDRTTYFGQHLDALGILQEKFHTYIDGEPYQVRIATSTTGNVAHVLKGINEYGETYSIHFGTELGQRIIAQVEEDRAAAAEARNARLAPADR